MCQSRHRNKAKETRIKKEKAKQNKKIHYTVIVNCHPPGKVSLEY